MSFVRLHHVAAALLLLSVPAWGETPPIPSDLISRLEEELTAIESIESSTEIRRASKNIVRRAEALLQKYPDSPEHFRVLGVVFETQKLMFSIRQSDVYRDALLETAKRLRVAPDEFAGSRVEADLLLLQLELSRNESAPKDVALAIAQFADRYRDTPAEAKNLMMAASMAFDLGHRDLLDAFRETLSKRFSHDPLVTAFMRERFAAGGEINLRGAFRSVDGTRMSFPLGQTYVVCFWSMEAPLLKEKLADVKALQDRHKDAFKVYSFNLDELRDGGEGTLKRMKLDWIPMRLPGGAEHPLFQSVGGANRFTALVVGPHGLASINPMRKPATSLGSRYDASINSAPPSALLRSLCIGDFLLIHGPSPIKATLPAEVLERLRACFPDPPTRYRLSRSEALKNYADAEAICAEAITEHTRAADLWVVHNYRIVAGLGMWRLTGKLTNLDRAVDSAKAALAMDLPAGAGTIAHYGRATRALVMDNTDAHQVLTEFIAAVGGENASGAAVAAALMLSLEAHSRDQYVHYRNLLLSRNLEEPSAWPVASFLLDSSVSAALFERALPGTGGNPLETQAHRRRFTTAALPQIGGEAGNTTAIAFMEPPADKTAEKLQKDVVDFLIRTASTRPRGDLALIGAFRADDTNLVATTMKRNKWTFDTTFVSAEDWAMLSRQFGLCFADRTPNVFLIRPDGSILLALSGVSPDTERSGTFTSRIENALRDDDLAMADQALTDKNYVEYAAYLSTSLPLKNRKLSRHEPERLASNAHRRKLVWACMQIQDWERALESINLNISTHEQEGSKNRKRCEICRSQIFRLASRADLLRQLGRKDEAEEATRLVRNAMCPSGGDVEAVLAEAKGYLARKAPRYKSLEAFLSDEERSMRGARQDLYEFKLEHDLLMRARMLEELGRGAEAEADRKRAQALAWPYPAKAYDVSLLHEASLRRRDQARKLLEMNAWEKALEQLNTNIAIHHAEALRCDSVCKICGNQVQSFQYHAATLKGLGREKEAATSLAMAEHAKCPDDEARDSFKYFPINRMYGGGSGINRLNFIEGHMRGEVYANKQDRTYRLELAGDLVLRAQALEQLGETAKAAADRKRATALAYPFGPDALRNPEALPTRYVDVLNRGQE